MENKILKFKKHLVSGILDGSKTFTRRLLDDQNLSEGDLVDFINHDTGEVFAKGSITNVNEKRICDLLTSDFDKDEEYVTPEEMVRTFKRFYGDKITLDSTIKIISFKINQ